MDIINAVSELASLRDEADEAARRYDEAMVIFCSLMKNPLHDDVVAIEEVLEGREVVVVGVRNISRAQKIAFSGDITRDCAAGKVFAEDTSGVLHSLDLMGILPYVREDDYYFGDRFLTFPNDKDVLMGVCNWLRTKDDGQRVKNARELERYIASEFPNFLDYDYIEDYPQAALGL